MKVTVLGCGSSGGVPLIGNVWGSCDPSDPRNRRTRASILVEDSDTTVLIDTSPDVRQQLLTCELKRLDAVLYTHAHADHSHGIDDLRSVNWLINKPIDIYAEAATLTELKEKFAYIFSGSDKEKYYKPAASVHEVSGPFSVGSLDILPISQFHGTIRSTGYRFGDFAYSTDVNKFDDTAIDALRGVRTWILDAVRIKPHSTHFNLQQALEWIDVIKPERAFLTHLNHDMDYKTLTEQLPRGVSLAYDGLIIEGL